MTYEEVKQIRQNPTLADVDNDELSKMIDEVVEKQIYKKIEIWNNQASCPSCKYLFGNYKDIGRIFKERMSYCNNCGQKLKWGEDE